MKRRTWIVGGLLAGLGLWLGTRGDRARPQEEDQEAALRREQIQVSSARRWGLEHVLDTLDELGQRWSPETCAALDDLRRGTMGLLAFPDQARVLGLTTAQYLTRRAAPGSKQARAQAHYAAEMGAAATTFHSPVEAMQLVLLGRLAWLVELLASGQEVTAAQIGEVRRETRVHARQEDGSLVSAPLRCTRSA